MASVLVIGLEERKNFSDLRRVAEAAVIPYDEMVARAEAHALGATFDLSQNRRQTIEITMGWTVTFTVEEHKPGVPCRHLAVASPRPDRAPNQYAVQMVMDEFGFVNPVAACAVMPERLASGGVAISVIEPMSGRMRDIASEMQ